MKKALLLLSVLFCAAAIAAPRNYDAPFIITPRVVNVTQTSFTLMFRTHSESICWIETAPDDGTEWYQEVRQKHHQTAYGRYFFGQDHKIEVTGLTPGTAYRYRVLGTPATSGIRQDNLQGGKNFAWNPVWGKGGNHSRTCTIRTLDENAKQCKFSLVNDTHYNDAKLNALVSGMPADNDFLMLNGDIVSHCYNIDSVLVHTFLPIKEAISKTPVFFARGNHEGRGKDWYKMGAEFPTPTGQFYYTFRQGPAAIIVLDAGEDKPDSDVEYYGTAAYDQYRAEELKWLKKAVTQPEFVNAPQKICIMHIPTLCNKDSWYSQKWITENFTPVLEAAGVKLMLSGHHHRYILSKPGEDGSKYTIVVNSNTDRADVTVTASSITIATYDVQGQQTHALKL